MLWSQSKATWCRLYWSLLSASCGHLSINRGYGKNYFVIGISCTLSFVHSIMLIKLISWDLIKFEFDVVLDGGTQEASRGGKDKIYWVVWSQCRHNKKSPCCPSHNSCTNGILAVDSWNRRWYNSSLQVSSHIFTLQSFFLSPGSFYFQFLAIAIVLQMLSNISPFSSESSVLA